MPVKKNRFTQVAPKEGKWEAYFTDSPRERCLGCTPEEALGRLRALTAERDKAALAYQEVLENRRHKTSLAIFASVAIVGSIAIVLILSATAQVDTRHGKLYAHHRLHSHHSVQR